MLQAGRVVGLDHFLVLQVLLGRTDDAERNPKGLGKTVTVKDMVVKDGRGTHHCPTSPSQVIYSYYITLN